MNRRVIIDELEFEVPYGKLAAKTWHEEIDGCKRILALHGWMDNSGSFDTLIPKLKHDDGLYIVALDLPGHGKSSQLPPGSSYSDLTILMEVRRFLVQLDWIQSNESHKTFNKKKFSIVGHSLGAGVGLYYASLYPDEVDEVILLDFMKSRTMPSEQILANVAHTIDQLVNLVPTQLIPKSSHQQSNDTTSSHVASSNAQLSSATETKISAVKNADKGQVVVSQEAAIIATIDAHKKLGELSRNDVLCLLKRSTVALSTPPNSVIYSRDLRLNSMLNLREHIEINKIMFARVQCHILFVLAKKGLYVENEMFKDEMDTMEEFYRKRAKSYNIQWVNDADHYIHMNQTQKAADVINEYLKSPKDYKAIDSDNL